MDGVAAGSGTAIAYITPDRADPVGGMAPKVKQDAREFEESMGSDGWIAGRTPGP